MWRKLRWCGGAGVEMCGGRCAVWGALVRRCVEEGALFGVRWCEDVWRKVRWCGGAVVVRGRLRYAVGGRKYVQKVAHIRIYWGAGAREQVRNNIFTIM